MNALEVHLKALDSGLYSKLQETKSEVELLLGKYATNFPTYTDHSINHTSEVFKIASELLCEEELASLNADETYILSMSCLLHDIGMCVPEEKIFEISETKELLTYKESHPNLSKEDFIRNIHHILSKKFIMHEWEGLKIASVKYAKAIGIVAEGHRKVDLGNFDIYEPRYFAKSGKEFACLPYLASILRIADELDVTNSRTPKLLVKYYMPNNEVSIREWAKHIATSQRNYLDDIVIFEVDCSDQNIYAALQDQFDKIQNVINYCQKVVRAIPFIQTKQYKLNLSLVDVKYNFIGFDPKGIKFSFDVQNVVTAFIGEDLYKDKLTSLREAIQNSIDSCRYKSKVLKEKYKPFIKIFIEESKLIIEDNGAGMDEFIIENFFGRLASSFYEQEKIKTQFEAIGQFGVGVFSYFLISEYIDIETKAANGPALKFRFDKDPKSYFHFYDNPERKSPGTTITMYLKKDLVGKLTEVIIENYLKKIFRHIEIPIILKIGDNEISIEAKSFDIDGAKEINDRLKLVNKNIAKQLTVKTVYIDDDDIEGRCSLIIGKAREKTFSFETNLFDSDLFNAIRYSSEKSQIAFSQKGVFVNNYSATLLSLLIGDINIKKKVKINIDRNQFTDDTLIYNFIRRFEVKILKELFYSVLSKSKDEKERANLTSGFVRNYCSRAVNKKDYLSEQYANIFRESIFIRIFINGEDKIISLRELLTLHKKFVLITEYDDPVLVSKGLELPCVVGAGGFYAGMYDYLKDVFIKSFNCFPFLHIHEKKVYFVFEVQDDNEVFFERNEKFRELGLRSYGELVESNSGQFIINLMESKASPNIYMRSYIFINYNHPFSKYIIDNYKELNSNPTYRKIIVSALDYIYEIRRQKVIKKEAIKKLNLILGVLNPTACKFTSKNI